MRTLRWVLLLTGIVVLFYWKLVFTKQFSVLWDWEPVTQSYSWFNFAASSIHKGFLPIWDPYRFSGNSFIGEMQTGLFYPLKFLVYILPLDSNGMVPERIYSAFYVVTHLLAALFMFVLARHLRVSNFGSVVASVTFGLGGYLGNTLHPHTLDSGIWLPLIVYLFLRSAEENSIARAAFFASLSGISLGMTVLAGGIHMTIMSGIAIAATVVFYKDEPRRWQILGMAVLVAVMGFLFGSVQMLPSLEYGPLSYRWVGADLPIGFHNKVPYVFLGTGARFSPRSLFTFLFAGVNPGDEFPTNYFGVLPFLLAVVGVWRGWRNPWVKYCAALGLFSYLYTWGEFSLLHGVLYLVPGLDVAREAGRFILLTHFAGAILAGYGVDALFGALAPKDHSFGTFVRSARWLVIFLAAILLVGSLQTTVVIDDSLFMSFVFIVTAYVIFELLYRDHRSAGVKSAIMFVIVWDLYAFNFPVRNKPTMAAAKQDHMAELLDTRKLAEFFRSKSGVFRVHFDAINPPNIGNSYGIPMTGGMSATMLTDYFPYLGHPRMADLLNVRYTLSRADVPGRQPVFSEGEWRVYENASYGNRAWVVHDVQIDPSKERPPKRLSDSHFNIFQTAILDRALQAPIDPETDVHDTAETTRNEPTTMEFRVHSTGRGILVASEVFYPGWTALVNAQTVPIYRVDGLLRGVTVPNGDSIVRFEYRPWLVRFGFALTLAAILATVVLGFFSRAPGLKA
jgi:hypothetical protein